MEESIEHGGDGSRVAEQLSPVVDRAVGSEDRAGPLVAAHDDFEQVFGGVSRELSHAEIVDDEQRYYLMSRGLDGDRADRLQVRGFFEEALARFPEQSVVGPIRDRINAKYADAQREGRL